MLLLGAADVAATKRFYVDRGLAVAKSFGRKYVEFATPGPVKLALYGHQPRQGRRGPADGNRIDRLIVGGDVGSFTDPDGFAWELVNETINQH